MKSAWIMVTALISTVSLAAEPIVNVEFKKYRRIPGSAKEFCDESITPEVIDLADGKRTLALGERVQFLWENQDTKDISGPCQESGMQTIKEQGPITRVVLEIHMECPKRTTVGSSRSTLVLKGREIKYKTEDLMQLKSGQWQTSGKGYSCFWRQ